MSTSPVQLALSTDLLLKYWFAKLYVVLETLTWLICMLDNIFESS